MRKVCLVVLLSLSACREPKLPAKAQSQERDSATNWQRQTECAKQADRIANRVGLNEPRSEDTVSTTGWSNHYSRRFERCYVKLAYLNSTARLEEGVVRAHYELWDAFESKQVAVCSSTVEQSHVYCVNIENGTSGDCQACGRFVEERMTK